MTPLAKTWQGIREYAANRHSATTRAEVVFLALGLLLCGVTRFTRLDILAPFADEGIYVHWSQVMANSPIHYDFPIESGKQPLFMWLVSLILVSSRGIDPFMAGRLVSAVSGVAQAILVYGVARRLYTRLVALVALFFQALSVYPLFNDRLAIVDSLLTTCGVAVMLV